MPEIDFITSVHTGSSRNYLERVVDHDKAVCAEIARQWGADYWDGDRKYGYGGYRYDGRWRPIAEAMAKHYDLKAGDKILDIGCGKAYLLYEFTQVVPGIEITGVDVSEYGIANAKPEIKDRLQRACATHLPFEDNEFDFVYSINTLHNLMNFELHQSLQEISRVSRSDKGYIVVESYRDEREKANLLYWQLTCETFYRPEEWTWLYRLAGYEGDYGFIYFD